ncbi:MAG: S1 RNA-binding domain-containing protein, partial [Chloroflexota bacterium]|nr:S1 RNA-binding domain-containing protein [Chloroflexota bacterium]
WEHVSHPREALKIGQKVDVYILRLDYERKRIGLSIKRLQPDPWAMVNEKYEVGQLVKGTITGIVDFGAFARIEPGLEGLIHISELAEGHVAQPSQVVQKGAELTLRIISIEPERGRMGLSLRQVHQPTETREDAGEGVPIEFSYEFSQ